MREIGGGVGASEWLVVVRGRSKRVFFFGKRRKSGSESSIYCLKNESTIDLTD